MTDVLDETLPKPPQDNESFLRRLAGASVTKAGLANDQTEINRIIAEASKGSKFYENEKRKDMELTERINMILRKRDELLREADMGKVEADADRLLEEIEAGRDLSQVIVHVDMDAFFANVELLTNPDLKGKPFGVGGIGVLSTASYEARKYGVRSGMACFVAKKLCPELILIPVDFAKISKKSNEVMSILKEYDPTMIVAGCDESYLNITKYCDEHDLTSDECVNQMRERIHKETLLTASAGIAPNKMLAKICSDKNKPNGQFHLPFEREAIKKFMRDLPIRKIPGIGRVNERMLESIDVKTCGDIFTQRSVIWIMEHYFWKIFLYSVYLGIASNSVEPYQREERKSIGAERTFGSLSNLDKLLEKLQEVTEELEKDMAKRGWAGKTVTLKYKLDTFKVHTRAKTLSRWVHKKEDLFNVGKELLKAELPLCLRLIGLRVTKLKDLRTSEKHGIKRFFQGDNSIENNESTSKKRKIVFDEPSGEDSDDNGSLYEGHEDNLPDFFENENGELVLHDNASSEFLEGPAEPASPKKKQFSSSKPSSSKISKPPAESASKRSSSPARAKTPHQSPPLTQPCPICAKELDTSDNLALNAHIDFCLSKDVIKEAASSSSTPTEKLKKPTSNPRTIHRPSSSSSKSRGNKKSQSKSKSDRTLADLDWIRHKGKK